MSIEIVGPFVQDWRVEIDGYEIPYVTVNFRGGDENGPNWTLCVDRRFATEYVTREEIQRWAYVIASMGAVCSGFSSHGENSIPLNRFKCSSIGIGSDDMAAMRRESIELVPPVGPEPGS